MTKSHTTMSHFVSIIIYMNTCFILTSIRFPRQFSLLQIPVTAVTINQCLLEKTGFRLHWLSYCDGILWGQVCVLRSNLFVTLFLVLTCITSRLTAFYCHSNEFHSLPYSILHNSCSPTFVFTSAIFWCNVSFKHGKTTENRYLSKCSFSTLPDWQNSWAFPVFFINVLLFF